MASNGWQGSAQFIEQNKGRTSYSGGTGGGGSVDMYGSFPTDQIIGQQTVDDKAAANARDAQNLLVNYGSQISGEDRSFLQTLGQNTGFFTALSGIGKVIEFISRPVGLMGLAAQEHAPSGPLATVLGGPLGAWLWSRNNDWSDFFKTGEERAVESGLSEGITAGDYWLMLSGQREALIESVGETIAGEHGFVSGTNILEAGGLTVESLNSLPEGVRQLARIQRFNMSLSQDIVSDPLTYMSFGTGGMGRKVAMETATEAIDQAGRLARTTLIEVGSSTIDDTVRASLTKIERRFLDDAIEKVKAKEELGHFADDLTWSQKIDDVMDFRTTAYTKDSEAMSGLRSFAIKNEDDMFFGTRSQVSEAVDDVVHQIEIRNYGRGLNEGTWWGGFKDHAKAGKAPLWTTGGLRVGPPALTPNQRGLQWTIPGTQGMFRATGRKAGQPIKWAMTREGVGSSSWLRRMNDLWEKQVRGQLASDKPFRIAAKAGNGYYGMKAMNDYAPRAVINSLGEATLNEEMFTAVGLWGRAKRMISEGISKEKRDEMLRAVLEGTAAGTRVSPPPGSSVKQIELMDEFIGEFSAIFERMGKVAAQVDPAGIGRVAGEGRNFRPFVEMPKFTQLMQRIAAVYGDEIGGSTNLQSIAGRETYARQLTDALNKSGTSDTISRADVDNWLQMLGANENAPRVIHAVGMTEQMRFRRAGRSTVLAPVLDEAGEVVGKGEVGTFVSLSDLNDSLVRTTKAVLEMHDIPQKFKTKMEITAKGATKVEQALELDPGKQIATWLVDMSGVISERAKLAEGIIAGYVKQGVSQMNEVLLRATLVEAKLIDDITDTAVSTEVAIATRIEMAAAGPETVPYSVGGVTMHPPVKMAEDPAWIHMAKSIDTISGELDATMTEFPRQYQQAIDDLVAAGEDPTSAAAIAFNTLAYKHNESQAVFVDATGDILRRYRDEAIHLNVAAGDNYAEAIERAVRMTQKKSKALQAELDKLNAAFKAKYEGMAIEIKAGSFSLFDSDKGGKLSARAASQRTEQMGKAARDTAAGARATEAASTGPDAVAARHTAEVRELLADWLDAGTGGTFNYSIDKVEFSAGLGGKLPPSQVVRDADTVIALYHPSWIYRGGGTNETRKLITQIVGKQGDVGWGWWRSNMIQLDPAGTLWVPKGATDKKLIVMMEVAGDTGDLGGDALAAVSGMVQSQSAHVRRYIGDSGFVGIIGPDEIQRTAQKSVVPASPHMRNHYGVDGQTLGEFVAQNGTTIKAVRDANPGKIRWFSERHAGRRTVLEQAIEDPAGVKVRRPKLTDYPDRDEFKAALADYYEGKLASPDPADMAATTMRVYSPYWDMDPDVLKQFDDQMKAMDTALNTEMSSIDTVDYMFAELDRFAARHGFNEDEARILLDDWVEMRWDDVSPQLRAMYQEEHRYGRNAYAWEGHLKSMKERWKGVTPGDHGAVIRRQMDEVQSRYVIFDDAGNEMGRTRSRGSAPNTLDSESRSTDFEWIPAGTELNVPPSRYTPGKQVKAEKQFARPVTTVQDGVTAGIETRVGAEQAGSAVPAKRGLDEIAAEFDEIGPSLQARGSKRVKGVASPTSAADITGGVTPERQTLEILENQNVSATREVKKGEGRVTAIEAEAYAKYPGFIQALLDEPTSVMDRAARLASQQQAEWFDEVLLSFEPLLANPEFVISLRQQAVTVDDVLATIDRFRSTRSFTQLTESNSFRKFLAAGLDFYDETPEQFLEAAYAVTDYGSKTSKQLTEMLKAANVPGRSKATNKTKKIALLNEFYGDPMGAPVVVKGIKMERTTTAFGNAGGTNVGRPDSGGVIGKRSGLTFGNAHRRTDYTPNSVTKAVKAYEEDLNAAVTRSWEYHEDVADLAGLELRCPTSSSHSPCHAEVLARKADELVKTPYEVSSKGDSRFSALTATLEDGRTIETHYQVDYKGYPDWRTGKAARTGPIEGGIGFGDSKAQSIAAYTDLWRRWADENSELMRELHELTVQRGRVLNDQFADTSLVNQADALTQVMKERFPAVMPVREMADVKTPLVATAPELRPVANDYGSYEIPERLVASEWYKAAPTEQITNKLDDYAEELNKKQSLWQTDIGIRVEGHTPEEALDFYLAKEVEQQKIIDDLYEQQQGSGGMTRMQFFDASLENGTLDPKVYEMLKKQLEGKLTAQEVTKTMDSWMYREIPDAAVSNKAVGEAEAALEQINEEVVWVQSYLEDLTELNQELAFREVEGMQEVPGQMGLGDAELSQIYQDAMHALDEPLDEVPVAAAPTPVEEAAPVTDDMFEVTPEKITELGEDEVFVFGSNEAGRHGKGAAKTAADKFGAEQGKGVGLSGQSFAIPTKDEALETLPIETIEAYVRYFMDEAAKEPGKKFLVTKLGTGLAGIPEDDMAAMFRKVKVPDNVILPEGWRGEAGSFTLVDDQLPVELQPNLAGDYPVRFEQEIDNYFERVNTQYKDEMTVYQKNIELWNEVTDEERQLRWNEANAQNAEFDLPVAPFPEKPVAPELPDLTRQQAARTVVEEMRVTKRLDAFAAKSGRKPQRLRVLESEQIEPSGMQSRLSYRDTRTAADERIKVLKQENEELVAAGNEPIPIPDRDTLAREIANEINMRSLESDLKRQRKYLEGEGSLGEAGVFEGEKSVAHEEALARNAALIPEVEKGGFAVPPYPLTAPSGPVNAVTLGVSGLADGADTWFAQILTDMGIPLIHHVNPENYVKFSAKWPGVIDEGIPPLPATATRQQRTKRFIAGLPIRSMQNADEADMTIAFMPHLAEGMRSVGTMKTIQYVMSGGQLNPRFGKGATGWDNTWGADFGSVPNLMPDFIEIHPGAHIYVPRKTNTGKVIVVNGDPSDEGLRILREMLKGKVNIAGPRVMTKKGPMVLNPGEYKAMVEKTLKAAIPGRTGIVDEVAGMAPTPSGPVQPAALQGVPVERMNARIDQVDSILDEMMQNPISKMEEMGGFVEKVTALRDGDRINYMKTLLEAANEPGNMKGVKEFEKWYAENADQVDALIRATYGDDHTLVIKRSEGRYIPTVEHPYAEQTARAKTGKSFNELTQDVIDGNLSKEEALAKGMDTVVVAADLKLAIERNLADQQGLLDAPVTMKVADMWKHEQVIKDFDVLTKLIDISIHTGKSKSLRQFVGTEMRDGTFKTSVSWGRISDALANEPMRLEQLQRWVEAGWVADTPWATEKAFLEWWMNERTLLSRLTYTVDQLRNQMRRRISDAYIENIWFGTHANAEQAAVLTERLMAELYAIPDAPARSGIPITDRFTPNAELEPILSDRLKKGRVPAKNAEAMNIHLNYSDRMRNVSDQLRQWSRAPEFKASDGKEFLPRGDMATASDWYNHLADKIDDALSSPTVKERLPGPGMVTAESQGLGAGILAGYDIDPNFAHMFRETTANLGHLFTPYGFDQVKGATNYLTQMWKRWATVVRPAFHIRNVIGGVTNGMFGGVMPWDYYKWTPQVMKFRKGMKELTRGSFDVDMLRSKGGFDGIALKYVDEEYHQVFRDAWNEGIIQTGFARTEGLRVADYSKGTINPFDPDFYLATLGGATMESLEDVLRLTMYGKYHQQGQKQFGASMVNMLHFDYTDLTPIEETIKKFVPFYVWTRRNVPLQLRIISQAPGFILAIDKARRNWNESQYLQHPDMYTSSMDSTGWLLPFGRQDDDGWAQLTWQPDLPMMDLDNMPLFADGEGAWPIGRSAFNVGAWMQYGTDMLGPAFSVPYSTLTMQEGGSINAPRGIAEVMQVLDAATNAVGMEGMVQTGHAPDGTKTDVQIPRILDTLWHNLVPPAEDYLAMMGLAPRNPYRAADEGWLNSDDPGFWSFQGLQHGFMRGVGRGAGLRYDSPRQSFFDQKEAEDRISRIEYDLKRGIGG